jgi:actin-related protein
MKNQVFVIDNGSGMIKAGLSLKYNPRTCFPSILGKFLSS